MKKTSQKKSLFMRSRQELESQLLDDVSFRQYLELNHLIRFIPIFFPTNSNSPFLETIMFEKDRVSSGSTSNNSVGGNSSGISGLGQSGTANSSSGTTMSLMQANLPKLHSLLVIPENGIH